MKRTVSHHRLTITQAGKYPPMMIPKMKTHHYSETMSQGDHVFVRQMIMFFPSKPRKYRTPL